MNLEDTPLMSPVLEKQDALFWDSAGGGYFNTSGQDPHVSMRFKAEYDGAEPSPNSVAALNLLRLAQMAGSKRWRQQGERLLGAFAEKLRADPRSLPQMLVALDFDLGITRQIVLAGNPGAEDTQALIAAIHRQFIPNRILLFADGGPAQEFLANQLDFIRTVRPLEGKATAYVCEDYVCHLPTSDPAKVVELLAQKK